MSRFDALGRLLAMQTRPSEAPSLACQIRDDVNRIARNLDHGRDASIVSQFFCEL